MDKDIIATRTEYGDTFASSVWRENVFATQFHPEKSQRVGLQLLKNFVELAKVCRATRLAASYRYDEAE